MPQRLQQVFSEVPGDADATPAPAPAIFDRSGAVPRPRLGDLARELAAFLSDPAPPPPGAAVPRGDGHAVLVFPPFLFDDRMTQPLRDWLAALGYRCHGWGLGRCLAPSEAMLAASAARVEALARRYGGKVSLVGISLGGVVAREAAKCQSQRVRQVITLCSPFRLPTASRIEFLFRLAARREAHSLSPLLPGLAAAPPVPTSAIFSRRDGIIAWQSCRNEESAWAENIELGAAAHSTIARNPEALAILAERLAQPPGVWRKYAAPQAAVPSAPEP